MFKENLFKKYKFYLKKKSNDFSKKYLSQRINKIYYNLLYPNEINQNNEEKGEGEGEEEEEVCMCSVKNGFHSITKIFSYEKEI